MKPGLVIAALIGCAVIAYLVFYVGVDAVLKAALAVGWSGFAIILGFALCLFALLGFCWWSLLPHGKLAAWPVFIWGRMVRDSAAEVLPFSQVGGFVIGARAVILNGVSAPLAFASTVVDVTTEMMAEIAYVSLGVTLLITRGPQTSFATSVSSAVAIGVGVALVALVAFLVIQRRGFKIAEKLAERFMPRALAHAAAVTRTMDALHESPLRLGASSFLHLCGWVASALGTYIALRLMHADIGFLSVIAIDSLVYGMRSATFFVPNALGVQEAAYAGLAAMYGLGADVGIALSLLKRARDIAIGVPVLLAWQGLEGRRALATPKAEVQLLDD